MRSLGLKITRTLLTNEISLVSAALPGDGSLEPARAPPTVRNLVSVLRVPGKRFSRGNTSGGGQEEGEGVGRADDRLQGGLIVSTDPLDRIWSWAGSCTVSRINTTNASMRCYRFRSACTQNIGVHIYICVS
jgi:hypothetical protein